MILYLLWGQVYVLIYGFVEKKVASPWVANREVITAQTAIIIKKSNPTVPPRFLNHAVCRSKPFIVSKSTGGKNIIGNGWWIRRKLINATEKGYGKLRELSIIQMLGGGGLVECG